MKNTENYSLHTRHNNDLQLCQSNLAIYQKGAHYSGVKVFYNLPSDIKNISSNLKRFAKILKHFFIRHLSALWRNIILDGTCGRQFNFYSF